LSPASWRLRGRRDHLRRGRACEQVRAREGFAYLALLDRQEERPGL